MTQGKITVACSPFAGGRPTEAVTRQHRPLVWECMLGTVYSMNAAGEVRYHDYDYAAARAWAGVEEASDLRVARGRARPNDRLPVRWGKGEDSVVWRKKRVLWGVRGERRTEEQE